MAYYRKLGVFVRVPHEGGVKTRLVPPLSNEEASQLYAAFLRDLFLRLSKMKKISGTVFYSGGDPGALEAIVPRGYRLVPQQGTTLGDRMLGAFRLLLEDAGDSAVILGSDSPDVPLTYLKRAYLKLKHKDIVIGPSFDGGYYLIGLKKPAEPLFHKVAWGEPTVLRETLEKARTGGLSFALLPLWYDVDDADSLALLESMTLARRLEKKDRLHHTERALSRIRSRGEKS